MVDPTRNRLAGRELHDVVPLRRPVNPEGALQLTIRPPDLATFEVDLSVFHRGGSAEDTRAAGKRTWSQDFSGRPHLTEELIPVLAARYGSAPSATWANIRHALRTFWRYLDADSAFLDVQHLADVVDIHGVRFKRYVFDNSAGTAAYKFVRTILQAAKRHHGQATLFWTGIPHSKPKDKDIPSPEAVRAFYIALKSEARAIKRMFSEGEELADKGFDPRGEMRDPGSARWEWRENHAWIVRDLTRDFVPDKQGFLDNGAHGLYKANTPEQYHTGPEYLAPGQEERAREGFVGKLRWFFPAFHDTAIFFLLFQIGTGWNESTVCSIDVSEEGRWLEDHPLRPDLKMIRSWKARAGRDQVAISLAKPEFHPHQILRFMIERTRPLRATLEREIARIDSMLAFPEPGGDLDALRRRREQLAVKARSPWLFLATNKVGEVSAIQSGNPHLNGVLRATIERHELGTYAEELADFTTSDFRDAWIGYAYEKSGYNWLVAQMAAGHADPETVRRYLAQRRWRSFGERKVRALQDAIMREIRERRILDGAALRILVQRGDITEEQRKRLEDYRKRTRLGTGCKDPRNPPSHVAPDHSAGKLCRVQRCTICHHAVLFDESLDGIALRMAELTVIQERTPLAAWHESSYAVEKEATEFALRLFDETQAKQAVARHLEEVRSSGVTFDLVGIHGAAR